VVICLEKSIAIIRYCKNIEYWRYYIVLCHWKSRSTNCAWVLCDLSYNQLLLYMAYILCIACIIRLHRSRCRLGHWLSWAQGSCIRWGPDPPCKGPIIRERTVQGMPDDILLGAVQKWLSWSICRVGCRLAWTEVSSILIIFTTWCQCAVMEVYIGATWWIRLKFCPSEVAMQPYVENYFDHLFIV